MTARASAIIWCAYPLSTQSLPQPPNPSSPAVRATMQGNRRRDTRPERSIRSALHARGMRYRVDFPIRPVAGARPIRPDIVFPRARLAVFIDGCFWHGCPKHGTQPNRNAHYWTAKLKRNVERDRRHDVLLRGAGWTVLRIWEHDDVLKAVDRIECAYDSASMGLTPIANAASRARIS